MYKNILKKCLDELNKEPFKIDKVIGMLETLIEMDTPTQPTPYTPQSSTVPVPYFHNSGGSGLVDLMPTQSDESTNLEKLYGAGPVATVH